MTKHHEIVRSVSIFQTGVNEINMPEALEVRAAQGWSAYFRTARLQGANASTKYTAPNQWCPEQYSPETSSLKREVQPMSVAKVNATKGKERNET